MGRKRRKAAYVPYDYEAAYQDSLDNLEEEKERQELKSGRVRNIYATKEIRAGDQLEVEIYPEFTRQQIDRIPSAARRKKQQEAQRNLNNKNSRKMCERVIGENFGDRDLWGTLTYTDAEMPETMAEAIRNMQNYIKRLNYRRKKMGLKNLRYVYTTECSDKGRWHHHIILDGDMSMDEVEAVWKKGRRNQVRRLQRDENGLVGMARYITKEKKGKHQKTWCCSKGLRKPRESVSHYKTRQRDVDRMVAGELKVSEHLTKWYGEKYEFAESEIRKNKFNGRYYIYGRMRMKREYRKERIT